MPQLPGQHAIDRQILRRRGDEWVLVASRCRSCGDVHYPSRELCKRDLEPPDLVELGREGVVYEAVRVEVPPEGFDPPYWVAYVDMPEGVRVFAPLRWEREDPPGHGDRVRYRVEVVRRNPYEVLGPVFELVSEPVSEPVA